MARDFAATPGQLFRAHTDPALFARWVGPDAMTTRIEHWDARTGGSWRYVAERDGVQYRFRGCFHEVRPDRIVQTFTFEGERATGQDDRLDPDFCAELLGGMEQMEQVLRSSGQYGARVEVPGNADTQTRLLGFIGRDPFWPGR